MVTRFTSFGPNTVEETRDFLSRSLWAHVFVGNTASVRILEGLAFRQEGHERQSLYLRNSWHDILTFGRLRSEWLVGTP